MRQTTLAAANADKMEAEKLPPHSTAKPLTYEELVRAILALEVCAAQGLGF